MRSRLLLVLAVGLLPSLVSCGVVIRSGGYVPPAADALRGATFAWNQTDDRVVGDPRLRGNRFFEERLHEAIEWELSLRGINLTESSPDLLVHHHLSLEDHEWVQERTDPSEGSSSEVYTSEQGTVVVHLVDAKSGETVWLSWGQADIEVALRSPENMRRWVYELTAKIFQRWPVLERVSGRPPGPARPLAAGRNPFTDVAHP